MSSKAHFWYTKRQNKQVDDILQARFMLRHNTNDSYITMLLAMADNGFLIEVLYFSL
jgi:hypothetical protein